jgi:Zn-dependent peptidase ImmA (M78 family)
MAARYSLSKRKARELLRSAGIETPPIPVERLAELIQATIRYEPFEGEMSGMARRGQEQSVIGVNSSHSKTRRRFTIAHEIGHLLLHSDEDFHVDEKFPVWFRTGTASLAIDDREIEANQFAAELLMPSELLQQEVQKLSSGLDVDEAIAILAERFEVSPQAMTIRLSSLGTLK